MARGFTPISSEVLFGALEAAGFKRGRVGDETTYERANHRDPTLVVKVYTSVREGAGSARGKGEDAIRCVLISRVEGNRPCCVRKHKRVFRTGGEKAIIERTLERLRDLYAIANRLAGWPRCGNCGAHAWHSGQCVAYCERKKSRKRS